MNIIYNEKGQAAAPPTVKMDREAFLPVPRTEIRWLGSGGTHINSRGTNIMIDPLLEGFDMPLIAEPPILPAEVPFLDGVLITHVDGDHFSPADCLAMKHVCSGFHAPGYTARFMRDKGLPAAEHSIGESFDIGCVSVTLTPADHCWQNESPEHGYREWLQEDYCGYYLSTPDGTVWLPGDSRLMPEQLEMPAPDVILFDFSDNEWHITLKGAVKLANAYPAAELICIHWGCVDAPDMLPFNGDPSVLCDKVDNPSRIRVLAPGERFILGKK